MEIKRKETKNFFELFLFVALENILVYSIDFHI